MLAQPGKVIFHRMSHSGDFDVLLCRSLNAGSPERRNNLMLNLVIFGFPFAGPFGADMATAFAPLAAEIDKQPGWHPWV